MSARRIEWRSRGRLLLLGAFVAVYLLPLGVRPLFIPDEYRYAEIPREMLAGGDWIAPRLAGFRYFEKPPLSYWVGAAALAAFGENAFAVRFPSALAAGLCALLVSSLMRRSAEDDCSALLGAAILLGSGLFAGAGTYKIIDPLFTLFVTASLASAYLACEGEPRKAALGWALAGAAAGAAFLTKGFLGFALPALVLAPFLTWQRRWMTALRHAWIAPLGALAVALPWAVSIALRDPDFWNYFFWVEHVRRFTSETAQHREPVWFFVPVLLGGAMPWVLLWPAAASGLRERLRAPLVRLALCWLVLPFLFFSLSRGKLGTYILPCFPPLAILTASGLRAASAGPGGRPTGLRALAALFGAAALALAVAQLALGRLPRVYDEGEGLRLGLMWMAGLATCAAFAAAAASRTTGRALALAALAPIPLYCAYPFAVPERMLEVKAPGALLARHAERLSGGALLVSQAGLAPAVCWVARRSDVLVLGRPSELEYGGRRPDSKDRLLTVESFGAMLEALAPGRVAVLVARRDSYDEWAPRLPAPSLEDALGDFVYSEYAGARAAAPARAEPSSTSRVGTRGARAS